jgi:hypothetical protein
MSSRTALRLALTVIVIVALLVGVRHAGGSLLVALKHAHGMH